MSTSAPGTTAGGRREGFLAASMRSINKNIVKIIISAVCLAVIPLFVPPERLADLVGRADLAHTLPAFLLLLLTVFLSSVRFHGMMKSFRIVTSLKAAHKINILSQLAGLLAFQTLGQMIFRAAYGGQYVQNPQRLALLTLLEKAVALSTLLLFALAGSLYVTQRAHIDVGENLGLLVIVLAVAASGTAVYRLGLSPGQRRYSRKTWRLFKRLGLVKGGVISVVMHAMMLVAYLFVAAAYLPEESLLAMAGAFSVVMLSAALPISFAGWGVRELSASFLFSFLGYDPAIGVLVAASIGVLSLLGLGLHGLVVNAMKVPQLRHLPESLEGSETHLERAAAFFTGLMIAVLIGFQVRVPTGGGALTVNLADPVAFLAATIFLAMWYRQYLHQPIWRVRALAPAVSCFLALIAVGWLHGYLSHGLIGWATYNRGVGTVVLLAYLFSGAMVTAFFGRRAVLTIARAFLITTCCVLVLYVFAVVPMDRQAEEALHWNQVHFNGLIANRNALAFVLVLLLAVAVSLREAIIGRWRETAVALILFLLFISGSRTGALTGGILLLVALGLGRVSAKRTLVAVVAAAAGAALLPYALGIVPWTVDALSGGEAGMGGLLQIGRHHNDAQVAAALRVHEDRMASYLLGLEMWLENPVFGSGIGAFITQHAEGFPRPLTVHNSALWLLAETGIVGLAVFAVLPWAIVSHGWRRRRQRHGLAWDDLALLLCLGATVVFSQAHDILYQRILWFLLGVLAANRLRLSDTLAWRLRRSRPAPSRTPEEAA